MEYIFDIIKCKQRFFGFFRQFVSPLVLMHNDVGETGLTWSPEPDMGPCRYLLPPTTYIKQNCTLQARTH